MQIFGINAIISGGAGGIGQACCRMLLEEGATRVGVLDKDPVKLRTMVDLLAKEFGKDRILPLHVDIRNVDQIDQAVDLFHAHAGALHLIICNAGVLLDGAIYALTYRGESKYPKEKWNETLDTNLSGAFHLTQASLKYLLQNKTASPDAGNGCRGLIIIISSISRLGRAGQVAYSSSKGGLISFSLSLAQELAFYKIRCVAIAPGLVDTPMAGQIPEIYQKSMIDRVLVHRLARPAEIAHGIKFCIENEYFNGRILELDGGILA